MNLVGRQSAPQTSLPIAYVGPPAELQRASNPPTGLAERNKMLELAARQSDLHTQRAFELASHGAYFASRAECLQAIRLIAQALDTDHRTVEHSQALAAGLTAIREAQDFFPSGSRLEADLDVPAIVAGHRTPVLKGTAGRTVTPQAALQAYFTFAQRQLGVAGGEERAASMAYYGLGKLHAAVADQQIVSMRAARPKAMTFFQASLLVNPRNHMASNELGALLARAGRHEDARTALAHSVSIQPSVAGWHNLAVVHQRLGQTASAQRACWYADVATREETARGRHAGPNGSAVQWVDAGQLAETYRWQGDAQGEYVAHARTAHVGQYRLRPDDQLDMIYRLTREETSQPYRLNVGDEIRVESLIDPNLNRDLTIQPDGTITVRLLGQVKATGKTVTQLRDDLEQTYLKYYKVPAISVTPLKMNTKLEDLRATVDRRQGIGGQSQLARVTPEGTISLPALGSVPAQGLTLPELQQELNERYREHIEGIEVIPVLVQRAPRFVFVLGEVRNPGRFELAGPTTVIQAISMAGGWNVGSNLRQVVVFRRDDAWRLLATMVNLQAALYGHQPCPPGEIWLSDSDVVIVPKGKILIADEFIELVFTRGIYGVFPFSSSLSFSTLSTL